jgi:tetratricopeptide (TPR) repeat protein
MSEAAPTVIDNYRAAVAANPNSAEAQSNLGWGLYGLRKYDESIQAYEKALSLDANFVDAHYGLGLTLKEAGRKDRAAQEFETVIKLAPQLENNVRGTMLAKLAQGHINQMQGGDWKLDQAGVV